MLTIYSVFDIEHELTLVAELFVLDCVTMGSILTSRLSASFRLERQDGERSRLSRSVSFLGRNTYLACTFCPGIGKEPWSPLAPACPPLEMSPMENEFCLRCHRLTTSPLRFFSFEVDMRGDPFLIVNVDQTRTCNQTITSQEPYQLAVAVKG